MSLELSLGLILIFIIIFVGLINIFKLLFRITGLDSSKSLFQTISLFTNAGFTTNESELVAKDKARRKIAIAAMITGSSFNVIIVSLFISIFSSIGTTATMESLKICLIMFGIFVVLLLIFKIPFVSKFFEKTITKVATYFYEKRNKGNVITILDTIGKVAIAEVYIKEMPMIMDSKSVYESGLKAKFNINVLFIRRGDRTIEITKDTMFEVNDIVYVFGSHQNIKDLFIGSNKKQLELMERTHDINELTLIDNFGQNAMVEVKVNKLPEFIQNRTMKDNTLKSTYNLNVMMIKRNNELVNLTKDTIIEKKDILFLFGDYKTIKQIFIDNISK